jgi:hexosaminidase
MGPGVFHSVPVSGFRGATYLPAMRPSFRTIAVTLSMTAAAALTASAQGISAAPAGPGTIALIPQPVTLTPRTGRFQITARTVIWTDAASARVGRQLARYLEPATGYTVVVRSGGSAPTGAIVLRLDRTLRRLGAEGYTLDVRSDGITARAPELAGLFYAVQTIRQLLPPEIFREAPIAGVAWRIPAVSIEDQPRFAWRGAHLDVGRHFMPKEFVKKYIDLLALHKLNTFHWHLTEDQGWRIEIRKYPRLTGIGAWRKESLIGRQSGQRDTTQWRFDGEPHGGFYTQDDAREIVAYAAARFITVVPEIEMPGHALAAIAAYPELGVTGEQLEVGKRWGVYSDILNAEPTTVAFMQDVLTEVLEIFPGSFIHIGGDEADKAKWKVSPRIAQRIRELNLADEHELQSWFIRQMDSFLAARGRRLIGWDEILEGGLAPKAAVMSWRGTEGGIAAARAGHDVVMAPTSHTYLDYYQSRDTAAEPVAIGGFLPLDKVYSFDPMPPDLEPQFAKHVLGGQAQLWTEYMKTPKKVEYMAFPRLTALAEAVWTPIARKDYADYRRRLDTHLARLTALDVNFRKPDPP